MKELDIVLKALAEGLKVMAQGIDLVAGKIDEIASESKAEKKPAPKTPRKTAKARPGKAPAAKKTAQTDARKSRKPAASRKKTAGGPATSTEVIFTLIQQSTQAIDSAELARETGYNRKKVTNILYKLNKQNKIKRVGRGTYTAA